MKTKPQTLFFALIVLLGMPIAAFAQAARTSAPPAPQPKVAPVTTVSTSATITTSSAATATTAAAANTSSAATAAPTAASSANNTAQPQAAASGGNSAGPQTDPGITNGPVNKIIPAPMLMSYSQVKDSFGRRIADNFVVIQVTVTNSDITHQFILQDLMVVFDPNECDKARQFYQQFKADACHAQYDKYLQYPIAYAPTSQATLQAVAGMGQYRSPRNFFFKSLDFAATMGGALTGFNFVGRDGKAGLSVFNGTFLTASKSFIPDLTVGQLTQLNDQAYRPNTLVENKEAKTYSVFLPVNQLFTKENWDAYRHGGFDKKERAKNEAALELVRIMQLTLTAKVSGIAIQPVANQPTPDSGANSQRLSSASTSPTPSGTGLSSNQSATTSAGPSAPSSAPIASVQPATGSAAPPRTPQ